MKRYYVPILSERAVNEPESDAPGVPLRALCATRRNCIPAAEFEDAIAACNLLPGPASTQLAIWCGYRLRARRGATVAGICFITPGLALILALSAPFLAAHPPTWVLSAAADAGAAVPAVAVHAAWGLAPASWKRIQDPAQPGPHRTRPRRPEDSVRWRGPRRRSEHSPTAAVSSSSR